MVQLEMSGSEQKSQALRDHLQGLDGESKRQYVNRRRPGRVTKVNPSLIPLLRGEAIPYRLLSDEIDPPYGLENTTPRIGIAVSVIVSILLLSVLGLMAWAIMR